MKLHRVQVVAAAIGVVALGTMAPDAVASPPTGVKTMTLVTARSNDNIRVENDGIRLRTRQHTDVRVQNLVFNAGAVTGWHHHPGIVIVAVQSGAVTVWDSECHSKTYGPGLTNGAVFSEGGDERGQVTSADGASVFATLIVPQATPPVFRIEDEVPLCARG